MIPGNHPKFIHPFNLEDRIEYVEKLFNIRFTNIKSVQLDDKQAVKYELKGKILGSKISNPELLEKFGLALEKSRIIGTFK